MRRRGVGTGLGLAICKGLVEAMAGASAPRAAAWAGARASRSPSPRPAIPTAPRGAGEPTPILVLDDDPQTLRDVRDALSAAGYAPLVIGDPDEFAALILTEKRKLVLLALVLPGTDGIELMEQVAELADVPVIFISGYGRDATVVRALKSGAADCIVKPFSATELATRVDATLTATE